MWWEKGEGEALQVLDRMREGPVSGKRAEQMRCIGEAANVRGKMGDKSSAVRLAAR